MAISDETKAKLKETIERAEKEIPELEEDIRRGELAGLDMSAAKANLKETKARVQGLKTQFLDR